MFPPSIFPPSAWSMEPRRTSPTVTHHEKPWEEEGLCTFRFHVILFVLRLPSELLISGQTDDDYVYGNAVEEEDERTKILFTNIYLTIFSLIRLVRQSTRTRKTRHSVCGDMLISSSAAAVFCNLAKLCNIWWLMNITKSFYWLLWLS